MTAERHASGAGTTVTLRWIYLHVIEETARHRHADLLREAIDGTTGV